MPHHIRIAESFHNDPDLDSLSDSAAILHICAATWANRMQTDGRIPKPRVARLKGGENPTAVVELIRIGWWTDQITHYQIRSFLKYNQSREKRERTRAANRERTQRHRAARTSGTNPGAAVDSSAKTGLPDHRNAVTNAAGNAPDTLTPVPVPESESEFGFPKKEGERAPVHETNAKDRDHPSQAPTPIPVRPSSGICRIAYPKRPTGGTKETGRWGLVNVVRDRNGRLIEGPTEESGRAPPG